MSKFSALNSWVELNAWLLKAKEGECWEALSKEKSGKGRPQYLLRIYGRANKLRTQRERQQLVSRK